MLNCRCRFLCAYFECLTRSHALLQAEDKVHKEKRRLKKESRKFEEQKNILAIHLNTAMRVQQICFASWSVSVPCILDQDVCSPDNLRLSLNVPTNIELKCSECFSDVCQAKLVIQMRVLCLLFYTGSACTQGADKTTPKRQKGSFETTADWKGCTWEDIP